MNDLILGWIMIIGSPLVGMIIILFILTVLKAPRLIVRDLSSKKAFTKIYLISQKKDKETGVLWWKNVFWQPKLMVESPPPDAIDVGVRGTKFAECYRITEDEFVWIRDKGLKYDKATGVITGYTTEEGYKQVDTFQPFSVVQRETIVNQFKKADEIRKRRWSPDKIISMTAVLGFIIIIVMLFVFWADLARPALNMANTATTWQQNMIKLEQSRGCWTNQAQTPPDQSGGGITQPGTESPPT